MTPIDVAIHGPRRTISRPISLPALPSYAGPRAACTMSSPTSAKTPAAAATAANETSDMLMTWRLARAGESAARVSGTLDTTPSDVAVTDNERSRDEIGVGEARDGPCPEPAREAQADDEERLQRDRQARKREPIHRAAPARATTRVAPTRRAPGARRGRPRASRPVQQRPPRTRDDPVLVDAPEDERQAEHASERVPRGGSGIAVVCGETRSPRARRRGGRPLPERGTRAPPRRPAAQSAAGRRRAASPTSRLRTSPGGAPAPRRSEIASAYEPNRLPNVPFARARARFGSTAARTALAARTRTRKTP